jgi:hypothetical protein
VGTSEALGALGSGGAWSGLTFNTVGPDEPERRIRERLDALGPVPRAELLHVLMLPASSAPTRSARTLGALHDLAEWALVFGLSLVLYTGIGWLRVWSMEQPPTSPLTERHARTGRRLFSRSFSLPVSH